VVPSRFTKTWFTGSIQFLSIQNGVLLWPGCHPILWSHMMRRHYLTYWEQLEVVAIQWFRRDSPKRDLQVQFNFWAYRMEHCWWLIATQFCDPIWYIDPIWPTGNKQKWLQPVGPVAIQQTVIHRFNSISQHTEWSILDSWLPLIFIIPYDG
jgi:hypothetical protein